MNFDEKTFIATSEDDGIRIDKYLSKELPELSRSFISGHFDKDSFYLNGKISKKSALIHTGDEIKAFVPQSVDPEILAEDIPLDILYEDKDILVVNKPKDMVVHPAAGHISGTLVNAVMFHCRDDLSGINGVLRPGIVHRIDKNTTGSIIVCKNDFAHNSIADQLKKHTINKIYLALVCGIIEEDDGVVNKPIGRSTIDRKKMSINYTHGKEAITHYHVLKRFYKDRITFVSCKLETGRTHQIRVHMADIGHPLLGDDVYNSQKNTKLKLNGQCLHASVLGFIHPKSGEYIETKAPLPEYFEHLLEILE